MSTQEWMTAPKEVCFEICHNVIIIVIVNIGGKIVCDDGWRRHVIESNIIGACDDGQTESLTSVFLYKHKCVLLFLK